MIRCDAVWCANGTRDSKMGKIKLMLTAQDEGLKLSREEFAEADYEEPWRFERAAGRLVVMVPAGHDHHRTVEPLRDHLVVYKVSHPDVVEHVFQESWTSVDDDHDRFPDIAVYLRESSGRIPDRVPELIFEVVSESAKDRHRDYEEKRSEYQRLGVQEYVIIDRFEHRVTVLSLKDGVYVEHNLGPDDVYTSPLLTGLEIPLGSILSD